MFENWFTVIVAAAIAGIGSGIGVAIGQALYKALMEDKVNAFLDKKHREEALKKLRDIDPAKSIIFGNGKRMNPSTVVDNMLGKTGEIDEKETKESAY